MIKDRQLARIALAMTLVGIIAIYFVSNVVGPEHMKISEISRSDKGKQVIVNGTVLSSRITDGNLFMKITDNAANITIVMFESTLEAPGNGDFIIVTGQVNEYKSALEIIARVVKWNS